MCIDQDPQHTDTHALPFPSRLCLIEVWIMPSALTQHSCFTASIHLSSSARFTFLFSLLWLIINKMEGRKSLLWDVWNVSALTHADHLKAFPKMFKNHSCPPPWHIEDKMFHPPFSMRVETILSQNKTFYSSTTMQHPFNYRMMNTLYF